MPASNKKRPFSDLNKAQLFSLLAWVLVLILVLIALQFAPNIFTHKPSVAQIKQEDSLRNVWANIHQFNASTPSSSENIAEVETKLVDFDPNTASFETLTQLGFPAKTAHIFINYRDKINGFKNVDQIKKVYTLTDELFQKIKPHIKLSSNAEGNYENYNQYKSQYSNYTKFEQKPNSKTQVVEINQANEATFKSLYGIGDYYAHKIVEYREQLGGYIQLNQLKEIGLSDSLITALSPQLRLNSSFCTQIKYQPSHRSRTCQASIF